VTKDPVISQSNEASWGGGRDRNAVLGTKGLGSWGRGLALPLPCLPWGGPGRERRELTGRRVVDEHY